MFSLKPDRLMVLVLALALGLPALQAGAVERPDRHVDVWLRNEAGDRITPFDNASDPYSPKKTCGACHQYTTVTKGYHFRMGSAGDKVSRGPSHLPTEIFPGEARPGPCPGAGIYDWIGENASRHPGGGPMEEALQRPSGKDFPVSLLEAEKLSAGGGGPEFTSRHAPDKRSHFRESGILEADCLMCHLSGYKLDRRNAQLEARNYRWAATAGAGLGEVRGRVFTTDGREGSWEFSRRPAVSYRWQGSPFTREGKLSGRSILTSVPSRNCLQCHGTPQAFHTGTLHRSGDDVHVKAGFRCVDCHGLATAVPGGRLSHSIGRNASGGPRDKTGMSTCTLCHLSGQYRPSRAGMPARAPDPRMTHEEKLPNASFHLRLLDCTACHVTAVPGRGACLLDASTGSPSWYSSDRLSLLASRGDGAKPAREPWKPWLSVLDLKRDRGERYVPVNLHTAQWFGRKGPEGSILPLDRETVAAAHERSGTLSRVKVKDAAGTAVQRETVASQADIEKMLASLRQMGIEKAVFVSDKVHELKGGKVVSSDNPHGNTLALPLMHGVAPLAKKGTWGVHGCTDCHSEKSAFFMKMKVRNVGGFLKGSYPVPKEPDAYPQMLDWGFEEVPSHE